MRKLLPPILCIFAATLLIAICFNPGCSNEDTNTMWWDSVHHRYENWHPATFAILWTFLRHIYDGTQSMLVFQLLAFTTGLALTLSALTRTWAGCLVFFGAIAVPPVLGLLGTITKDSVMGCVLVLAVGCCFAYAASHNKILFACGVASSYLAFALRHNGVIAVLPVLVLLSWLFFSQRTLRQRAVLVPGMVIVCLLSFFALRELTLTFFKVERLHPEERLLLYDLGALSGVSNEILAPSAFVVPGTTVENIRQATSLYNGDWLLFAARPVFKQADNPADLKSLTNAWILAVRKHPLAYLRWRLQVFDAFAGFYAPDVLPYGTVCQSPWGNGSATASGPLYRTVSALLTYLAPSLLFRPYIYIALLLIVAAFAIWKKRLDLVLIAASGLFYAAGNIFLIQQGAFRYACPTVFLAVVLIARFLSEQTASWFPVRETAISVPSARQIKA